MINTNFSPDDIVIAVMGATGTGKSSFISLFTNEKLVVGNSLSSCTTEVKVHQCSSTLCNKFFLVDTPGFDDKLRSDADILRELASWLANAYSHELKLSGLIYFQRISDPRVTGVTMRNLRIFKKLCGEKGLGSVVLATTFWNLVEINTAEKREAELRNSPDFFGNLIAHGSKMFRLYNSRASGEAIIQYLVNLRSKTPMNIQKEMVDEKKRLDQTAAGMELQLGSSQLQEKYEKAILALQEDMAVALSEKDHDFQVEIERERDRLKNLIREINEGRAKLRVDQEQLWQQRSKPYLQEMDKNKEGSGLSDSSLFMGMKGSFGGQIMASAEYITREDSQSYMFGNQVKVTSSTRAREEPGSSKHRAANGDAPEVRTAAQDGSCDLHSKDVAIVVMGPTGAGKSSLISLLTEGHHNIVGHGLSSYTTEVRAYSFADKEHGCILHLVDTPGFDDTYERDAAILSDIAFFLSQTYQQGLYLQGVIYLQDILLNRLHGSTIRNIETFKQLTGHDVFDRVTLVTTKWDSLIEHGESMDLGILRENLLVESRELWGSVLEKGCHLTRHNNTRESALNIISSLPMTNRKWTLQIQQEMVDEGKTLEETTAGQKVSRELHLRYESLSHGSSTLNAALERMQKQLKEVKFTHEQFQREAERRIALLVEESTRQQQRSDLGAQILQLMLPLLQGNYIQFVAQRTKLEDGGDRPWALEDILASLRGRPSTPPPSYERSGIPIVSSQPPETQTNAEEILAIRDDPMAERTSATRI